MANLITAAEAKQISENNKGKEKPNRLFPSVLNAVKNAAMNGENAVSYQIPAVYRDLVDVTVHKLKYLGYTAAADRITYTDKIVINVMW